MFKIDLSTAVGEYHAARVGRTGVDGEQHGVAALESELARQLLADIDMALNELLAAWAVMTQAGEELPSAGAVVDAWYSGPETETGIMAGRHVLDLIRPIFARQQYHIETGTLLFNNREKAHEKVRRERDEALARAEKAESELATLRSYFDDGAPDLEEAVYGLLCTRNEMVQEKDRLERELARLAEERDGAPARAERAEADRETMRRERDAERRAWQRASGCLAPEGLAKALAKSEERAEQELHLARLGHQANAAELDAARAHIAELEAKLAALTPSPEEEQRRRDDESDALAFRVGG